MVQRPIVDATITIPVIPAQHCSGFRREAFLELREAGSSACRRLIEIYHECPGALSGDGAIFLKILPLRIEKIGVRLEFLTNGIALTLEGLAECFVYIGVATDFVVNLGHEAIGMVQITGFAGTEIVVAIRVCNG